MKHSQRKFVHMPRCIPELGVIKHKQLAAFQTTVQSGGPIWNKLLDNIKSILSL